MPFLPLFLLALSAAAGGGKARARAPSPRPRPRRTEAPEEPPRRRAKRRRVKVRKARTPSPGPVKKGEGVTPQTPKDVKTEKAQRSLAAECSYAKTVVRRRTKVMHKRAGEFRTAKRLAKKLKIKHQKAKDIVNKNPTDKNNRQEKRIRMERKEAIANLKRQKRRVKKSHAKAKKAAQVAESSCSVKAGTRDDAERKAAALARKRESAREARDRRRESATEARAARARPKSKIARHNARQATASRVKADSDALNAAAAEIRTADPPEIEQGSGPAQAARELRDYLVEEVKKAKRLNRTSAAAFGYRGHPNLEVKKAQRAFGFTDDDVDGIVGQQVRTACREHEIELPARWKP